jgi:hypothetical protein
VKGKHCFFDPRTSPLFNNKRKYSIFIEQIFINKILSKYIYVGSCFEGFIIRNTIVQSEFNLILGLVVTTFFSL